MAPFFTGIAGAIKGQSGFGFGRKARSRSRRVQIFSFDGNYSFSGPYSPVTGTVSIPSSTTEVEILCLGGGANGLSLGGKSKATFTSLAGKILSYAIAGGGEGAYSADFNGGAPYGNGKSYAGVFDGPVSQANALVIAGGVGGFGTNSQSVPESYGPGPTGWGNGGGGNNGGVNGIRSWRNDFITPSASRGGGASTSSGGAGGVGGYAPDGGGGNGNPGTALQGGLGGSDPHVPFQVSTGKGGGGGYWGGGGSAGGSGAPPQPLASPYAVASGGGGGSGYIHPSGTNTIGETGSPEGTTNGTVTITITDFI